jgi:hypothetical protein
MKSTLEKLGDMSFNRDSMDKMREEEHLNEWDIQIFSEVCQDDQREISRKSASSCPYELQTLSSVIREALDGLSLASEIHNVHASEKARLDRSFSDYGNGDDCAVAASSRLKLVLSRVELFVWYFSFDW